MGQGQAGGGWRLGALAAAWGAAEATLFFVVPDVLIAWAALRHGLRTAFFSALLATAGAAAGGALVVAWSIEDPAGAARAIEAVPAVPAGAVAMSAAALREGGLAAALRGAFTGVPFKVWSAAAPHAGWTTGRWAWAAVPVRLPRFLLMAVAVAVLGAALGKRLAPATTTKLFAGAWAVFYAAFWLLSPW